MLGGFRGIRLFGVAGLYTIYDARTQAAVRDFYCGVYPTYPLFSLLCGGAAQRPRPAELDAVLRDFGGVLRTRGAGAGQAAAALYAGGHGGDTAGDCGGWICDLVAHGERKFDYHEDDGR